MIKSKTIKMKALISEIESAIAPILADLEEAGASHKISYKTGLCLDELLTNVACYAYEEKEGEAEIRYDIADDPPSITITIIDEGKPFDPLQADEPDITAKIEQRKIGGLGIFIVKSFMDEINYKREGNFNILVLKKNF